MSNQLSNDRGGRGRTSADAGGRLRRSPPVLPHGDGLRIVASGRRGQAPRVQSRFGPGVQSWDIRGTATGTRSTMAIVLPGGERSPSPNRDRL
jgi:hypothetical protein